MLKRGIDQVTAWILAILLTGATGAGIFLLTKWSAGRHAGDEGDELSDHGPAAAHGEEHAAPSGHEAPEAHAEPGHGEKAEPAHEEKAEPAHEEKAPPAGEHGEQHGEEHGEAKPAPKAASKVAWEYKGSSGPDHWGELADAFRTCKTGKRQSPVDIDEPVTNAKMLPIKFHYKEADVVWKNNGHTLAGEMPSGNFVEVDGDRYDLVQFHFHAPSEHKIAGAPYDMEMHLIHKSAEGKFLEIAVLFEEGKGQKGLTALWKNLPGAGETHPEPIAFDPAALLPAKRTYYHYVGSSTVPPCTEGYKWYVLTSPVEASAKQVDEFVRVVSFNARPVQALNGRKVVKSTR